jgi:bifunctional non-homologous end joining protein LigD
MSRLGRLSDGLPGAILESPMPDKKAKAKFIEPMLLLRTEKLPEGPDWLCELKLDGYRSLAIKNGGGVQLRSRNDNDFNRRYPAIVKALASMPDETVIDGEVVALDEEGRPSFQYPAELFRWRPAALLHLRSAGS